MNVPPAQPNKPQPTFGILKGYKKTPYGATEKYNQKLHYVSNNQTLKWIESKLRYFQDGIKRIIRSKAK